jgi:hypothetical protein
VGRIFAPLTKVVKDMVTHPLSFANPMLYFALSDHAHAAFLRGFEPTLGQVPGVGRLYRQGAEGAIQFEQSRTVHWVKAGIILAGTAIATAECGACGTLPSFSMLGETVTVGTQTVLTGALIGEGVGAYGAAQSGQNPLNAVVVNGIVGAANAFVGETLQPFMNWGTLLTSAFGETNLPLSAIANSIMSNTEASIAVNATKAAIEGTNMGQAAKLGAITGAIEGGLDEEVKSDPLLKASVGFTVEGVLFPDQH